MGALFLSHDNFQIQFGRVAYIDLILSLTDSIWEFDHPFAGPMRQARPPARFSETPSEIFHCSPELGQHTRDILSEFGIDEERARELMQQKIAK